MGIGEKISEERSVEDRFNDLVKLYALSPAAPTDMSGAIRTGWIGIKFPLENLPARLQVPEEDELPISDVDWVWFTITDVLDEDDKVGIEHELTFYSGDRVVMTVLNDIDEGLTVVVGNEWTGAHIPDDVAEEMLKGFEPETVASV